MIDLDYIKENDLIRHIKSGEVYIFKNLVLIQIKQEWVQGVRYTNKFNQEFVRKVEDFVKSFTKL